MERPHGLVAHIGRAEEKFTEGGECMKLGKQIADLLIETGTPWTVTMLAKHFKRNSNSITSSLTTVRRHCHLSEKRKSSTNGSPQYWYSAMVSEGCGLLYSPKPQITMKPYFVNQPFHPCHDWKRYSLVYSFGDMLSYRHGFR